MHVYTCMHMHIDNIFAIDRQIDNISGQKVNQTLTVNQTISQILTLYFLTIVYTLFREREGVEDLSPQPAHVLDAEVRGVGVEAAVAVVRRVHHLPDRRLRQLHVLAVPGPGHAQVHDRQATGAAALRAVEPRAGALVGVVVRPEGDVDGEGVQQLLEAPSQRCGHRLVPRPRGEVGGGDVVGAVRAEDDPGGEAAVNGHKVLLNERCRMVVRVRVSVRVSVSVRVKC